MTRSQTARFSRRALLEALVIGPLAAAGFPRLGRARQPQQPLAPVTKSPGRQRVIVVGAGAFGGWTALHLLRQGAEVVLLDAWGPGNSRSSSGGESRVIRAIYGADRIYTEMVRRSFELWGDLELVSGSKLYRETGCLWMFRGDDDYGRAALPVMAELDFPVEQPSPAEAGKRWPQIDFSGVSSVYFEPRSGALAARRACRVVRDRVQAEGGTFRLARVEPAKLRAGRLDGVRLGDGSRLEADSYVFACGPWLGRLFPEVIGEGIQPTRQEVFYFGPPAGVSDYDFGQLPVWIDFGERVFYGHPRSEGRGMKLADDTRGEPFDPTSGERTPSEAAIQAARGFLAERFPGLARAPLVEARVCQYENSPDGDLIVDRHPEAENLWLAGGGSGHGFKLSPALGEHLADRILENSPAEPRFRLDRLQHLTQPSTQFETQEDAA